MKLPWPEWINIGLTAAIAFAGVMQWLVLRKLREIESSREKVRLLLRFVRSPYGVGIRIANLSHFGIFIEEIECSIVAALPDGVPPINPGEDKFTAAGIWNQRNVLAAFDTQVIDVQAKIQETIGGRNAEFVCDLEARAVYIDHGKERTTPPQRIRAKVHQQRLIKYLSE